MPGNGKANEGGALDSTCCPGASPAVLSSRRQERPRVRGRNPRRQRRAQQPHSPGPGLRPSGDLRTARLWQGRGGTSLDSGLAGQGSPTGPGAEPGQGSGASGRGAAVREGNQSDAPACLMGDGPSPPPAPGSHRARCRHGLQGPGPLPVYPPLPEDAWQSPAPFPSGGEASLDHRPRVRTQSCSSWR